MRAMFGARSNMEKHRCDVRQPLESREQAAFLATRVDEVAGFSETALRHAYVDRCRTSPIAFQEVCS